MGVGFFINPPLKSSPIDKMSPLFKRGAVYLLKSTHKYFVVFGKLCNSRQWCHIYAPSIWITPTKACPTKNSIDRCLGYVAFECHANSQIN